MQILYKLQVSQNRIAAQSFRAQFSQVTWQWCISHSDCSYCTATTIIRTALLVLCHKPQMTCCQNRPTTLYWWCPSSQPTCDSSFNYARIIVCVQGPCSARHVGTLPNHSATTPGLPMPLLWHAQNSSNYCLPKLEPLHSFSRPVPCLCLCPSVSFSFCSSHCSSVERVSWSMVDSINSFPIYTTFCWIFFSSRHTSWCYTWVAPSTNVCNWPAKWHTCSWSIVPIHGLANPHDLSIVHRSPITHEFPIVHRSPVEHDSPIAHRSLVSSGKHLLITMCSPICRT